jgi:hypothetical protein
MKISTLSPCCDAHQPYMNLSMPTEFSIDSPTSMKEMEKAALELRPAMEKLEQQIFLGDRT